MDNWSNSPALVSKLSQLGFGACGTVRYTTRGIRDFANLKKHPMKRDADPQFYQKAVPTMRHMAGYEACHSPDKLWRLQCHHETDPQQEEFDWIS